MTAASVAATAVAALVSGAPSTMHSIATRRPLLDTVRAAATLVPRCAPANPGRPVGAPPLSLGTLVAGGFAHGAVSLFWGTVLAQVLPPGRRAIWGAAAGAGIHVVDLGLVARLPHLAAMRALPQLPQLGDHIAFGATVGFLLDRWDPPMRSTGPAGQATSSSAFG